MQTPTSNQIIIGGNRQALVGSNIICVKVEKTLAQNYYNESSFTMGKELNPIFKSNNRFYFYIVSFQIYYHFGYTIASLCKVSAIRDYMLVHYFLGQANYFLSFR